MTYTTTLHRFRGMSKNVLSVALISQANNSTFAWFSKLNVWAWQSSTQLSLVCFVRVTTKRHKAQRPPVKSLLQKILMQKGPPYERGLPKIFLIDYIMILFLKLFVCKIFLYSSTIIRILFFYISLIVIC